MNESASLKNLKIAKQNAISCLNIFEKEFEQLVDHLNLGYFPQFNMIYNDCDKNYNLIDFALFNMQLLNQIIGTVYKSDVAVENLPCS